MKLGDYETASDSKVDMLDFYTKGKRRAPTAIFIFLVMSFWYTRGSFLSHTKFNMFT